MAPPFADIPSVLAVSGVGDVTADMSGIGSILAPSGTGGTYNPLSSGYGAPDPQGTQSGGDNMGGGAGPGPGGGGGDPMGDVHVPPAFSGGGGDGTSGGGG